MKKKIIPVIAFLVGALGFSTIKLYSSDALILSKADASYYNNQEQGSHQSSNIHISHTSHISHYSSMSIQVERDSLKNMSEEQVQLCTQNIPKEENDIIEVVNAYIAKRIDINIFLDKKIQELISLPENEICYFFTLKKHFYGFFKDDDHVTQTYTYIIPKNNNIDIFYVIKPQYDHGDFDHKDVSISKKISKERKNEWMYKMPNF